MKRGIAPLVGILTIWFVWMFAKKALPEMVWSMGIMLGIFAVLILIIRLLDEY